MNSFFIDIKTEYGYEKVMEHVRKLSLMHSKIAPLKGYAQRIEIQAGDGFIKYFQTLNENLEIPGGIGITHDELGLI